MTKQQARMMGFALVLSFAALRAMAGSTSPHMDHATSFSPMALAFGTSFR
jgi:hypothetical protein